MSEEVPGATRRHDQEEYLGHNDDDSEPDKDQSENEGSELDDEELMRIDIPCIMFNTLSYFTNHSF